MPHRAPCGGKPGTCRHVSKRPVALIVVENIVAVVRNQNVFVPVVVVVAGTYALAPSCVHQSRSCGHVFKLQIAKVLNSLLVGWDLVAMLVQHSCIYKENIFKAVSVIVEDGNPTSGRFKNEPLIDRIAGFMLELETGFGGDIVERDIGVDDRSVAGFS